MEPKVVHRRLLAVLSGVACALAVVVLTAVVLPAQGEVDATRDSGYVYSGAKSASVDFVRASLGSDTLLTLGSSEFSTPSSLVPQVPAVTFGEHDRGLSLMLVGEAFDQALWHTIALGALADGGLPRNKVVYILGLGQYTDGGVDPATFQERFSYALYSAFCKNDEIGEDVRTYVRERLADLGVGEMTLAAADPKDPIAAIDGAVFSAMADLDLRAKLQDVRSRGIERPTGGLELPDWDALMAEALADAQRMSTNNDLGAEDAFFESQLGPALEAPAGARAEETYTDTPEYDDLDCFLSVCDQLGVEPLVVVEPVMGPYYDHIGITQEKRQAAYAHIRDIVAAHPTARIADFSEREYEPYFLYDIVHFGWCGWVSAEQAIYEFWGGGQ